MRGSAGTTSVPKDLIDILADSQGILSEPYPRGAAQAGTILSTGVVYCTAIPLFAGDQVSGIAANTTVAGSAQTSVFVGLYNARSLALLATSADVKADFAATAGNRVNALASVVTAPYTGIYYAAVLGVGGTQPTLLRSHAVAAANDVLTGLSAYPLAFVMTAQATLPATITQTNAGSVPFWLAAY
jgi:hypothetical protein